jgi:signal transduction histidine kinase
VHRPGKHLYYRRKVSRRFWFPKPFQFPWLTKYLRRVIFISGNQTSSFTLLKFNSPVFGGVKNVFVDSAQIASAIANIIANSVQSYADSTGLVKIIASVDKSTGGRLAPGGFVRLTIADLGCGMDAGSFL